MSPSSILILLNVIWSFSDHLRLTLFELERIRSICWHICEPQAERICAKEFKFGSAVLGGHNNETIIQETVADKSQY